jgi:hypothetical protein
MSWDIYVYAEVKNDDKFPDWKPLCDRCVCDNFKYYNEGFTDELPKMNASESSHPSVKNLQNEIYGCSEFKVCYCSLKTLRNHYNSVVENFNTHLRAVYSALGVNGLCIEDGNYWHDDEEDVDSNMDVDQSNPWVKYMTFPVNKTMLSDLAVYICKYAKALQVIGMCDTLSSMCENYNDEVRLIFATL